MEAAVGQEVVGEAVGREAEAAVEGQLTSSKKSVVVAATVAAEEVS